MKHLPDATTEGLICSSDGLLLESFISNLFIVEQRGSSLVVKTAMCNVLPGIKQQQVLDACRALGIQVEHTGAQQSDRHLWVEAFLSNAVKGLRPINKIACLPNNPFGWDPWEVSLAVAPDNSIYTRLQEQLDRDVKNVTTFVLDDAS